jgi:hypothetical protein
METMIMTVNYVAARARRAWRVLFRNDAGALTLEWLVIGVALVAAVAVGAKLFTTAIKAEAGKLP